jgi:t-SNARE complex subunit (syntaxin)
MKLAICKENSDCNVQKKNKTAAKKLLEIIKHFEYVETEKKHKNECKEHLQYTICIGPYVRRFILGN